MAFKKENGRVGILLFRLNSVSSQSVRGTRIEAIVIVTDKYKGTIMATNKFGAKIDNLERGTNFQSLARDGGKSRCVMTYNKKDKNDKSNKPIRGDMNICIRSNGLVCQE